MKKNKLTDGKAEILFLTSYPPRECGIATYSQDLIRALNNKFSSSFSIRVCALESNGNTYPYPDEVAWTLKTSIAADYKKTATRINQDPDIKIVLVQHEFGFFNKQKQPFLALLKEITKPVAIVFHTVLPKPDKLLKSHIQEIAAICTSIIVMTNNSVNILKSDYGVPTEKITVIAHGTHLVPHLSEKMLKVKYGLKNRKVLTTFGLLSAGKSIETTLDALPAIIKTCPDVVFLVIGKTHPEVVKTEGETYREMLMKKTDDLGIRDHVVFINEYLALQQLLEYLQLTDIYLFTSSDPNQAVSGTFVYAMSCACPIISTPIPHAKEVLSDDTGIIIDFRNSKQLADAVNRLLNDKPLRRNFSSNTLEKIVSTVWENSAVAHAVLFKKIGGDQINLQYDLPVINLNHMGHMTTETGIIQFSRINQPDIHTGYTLDDNARAMVASCMTYSLAGEADCIADIRTYLHFIKACLQPAGNFLNYMNQDGNFSDQNYTTNLDDSNGRAIWALGYLLSLSGTLPAEIISEAEEIMKKAIAVIEPVHSTRAMAFTIKGLYYHQQESKSIENLRLVRTLADRLVQMYRHEANDNWEWFEGYLTYANSILPEAMLYAWLLTREPVYKDIALASLNFLLFQIFNENGIEVISNKNWLQKGEVAGHFGEQPIDVAYTIMTLSKFYDVFMNDDYRVKMRTAFNWFLGNNRLHQVIYNPCTGGCYDGLEETHVNLNQGTESTVSYLMARITMEQQERSGDALKIPFRHHFKTHSSRHQFMYSTDHKKRQTV